MDYKMIYKNNPEGLGILLHSGEALGAAHRVTGAGSHSYLTIQGIWFKEGDQDVWFPIFPTSISFSCDLSIV